MSQRNPPAVPADTDPAAWRLQMQILAQRTPAQRLAEWAEFNDALALMEEAAMRRRHPDYGDRQVFLALVRGRYGDELAGTVWPDSLLVEP